MWWKKKEQYFSYRHDVHAHLLPGLDDGVRTVEEAVGIIEEMKSFGIESFSLTPHVAYPAMPNTEKHIQETLKELQSLLPEVRIEAGAEYRVGQEVLARAERVEVLPFFQQYVLIENNFQGESVYLDQMIFVLQTQGFTPVLAHPERYPYYYDQIPGKLQSLRKQGCLLQLNLLSLAGFYGRETEKMAWQMLKTGLISFVGSDVHRLSYAQELKEFLFSKSSGKLKEYKFLNQ